jgi:ferritin-like metal-binding protein YciE
MRTSVSILAIVLMVLTAMPRLGAQSHTAPQSALDAAVQQHVDAASADREAVLRVLDRSEVKAVADSVGIDLRRATSAISTLEGDELARVAAQARAVDTALAGGATVVVTTTMIIIALLVLILIIIAVD